MTAKSPYTLQWDAPSPVKIVPSYMVNLDPQCNRPTWFPGRTRVLNPNGISIDSVVFGGLTSVTDRQTDHATRSVTLNRIYVRSTAMWLKNSKG